MKKILPILIALATVSNSFSQNVGIGTNTPTSKLSVEGSDNSTLSKNAVIQLTNTAAGSNNSWYLRSGATGTFTPAGGFSIGDKTANRLIVDSNGNIGIGILPAFSLDVIRGTSISGTARFSGTTYPTQFNYGVAENTYISGGLPGSHIMMNFFGGGNVGVGQGIVPSSTFEVARGTGSATAYFHGSSYHSIFNSGANEETYIRGGKTGADVYINDNNSGKVRIGGNSAPIATLDVSRGNALKGTAAFRGTSFNSYFNYDTTENTYINGGKANSNILMNFFGGGNVGIGVNMTPVATLDVTRGTAQWGTAAFRGTNYNSHFNFDTTENTYIRGGKAYADVYINDINGGDVKIGGFGLVPAASLDVSRGFSPGGTAIFRGTNYMSHFNLDTSENTYIRGGKNYSDVYINDINGGDLKIGGFGLAPNASLDVSRGFSSGGTAIFRGTNYSSHFNYGTTEDTYIRGGIANSSVTINDQTGGKVGIGVIPTFTDGVLDVNGRMRIRSGGDIGHTAGIWLNNTDNSAQAAFIGMEDATHVGLYGLSTDFKFSMNTSTGALKINGSEGNAGEVLTSNGSGGAPSWKSGPASLFDNSISYAQSSNLHLNCNGCYGDMIPSTATLLAITRPSKILISYSGLVNPLSSGILGSDTRTIIHFTIIDQNGNPVVNDDYVMMAFRDGGSSFSKTTNLVYLTPGNYVMTLKATQISGSTVSGTDFGGGIITAVIMPQ